MLLVDDGEVNRSVHEELLQCEGAVVVAVVNGEQALKRVACNGADAFDIVLIDIDMPETDGYEATRRILRLAPGTPVIGQTASARVTNGHRSPAEGMVGRISEPIDPEGLVAAITRDIDRRSAKPGQLLETSTESATIAN